MRYVLKFTLVVCLLSTWTELLADYGIIASWSEAESSDGTVRAESYRTDDWGKEGVTKVFQTSDGKEELLYQFDWFAHRMMIENLPGGIALIRFNGWPRGVFASHEALGVEFYRGKELLRRYSTLDLAGSPNAPSRSASHHRVIANTSKVNLGPRTGRYELRVRKLDGWDIFFDVETGKALTGNDQFLEVRESDWFKENRRWVASEASSRAICAGDVAQVFGTTNRLVIQLSRPVLMEPFVQSSPNALQVIQTNLATLPKVGEAWVFAGTLRGMVLQAQSGKRYPQYEGPVADLVFVH